MGIRRDDRRIRGTDRRSVYLLLRLRLRGDGFQRLAVFILAEIVSLLIVLATESAVLHANKQDIRDAQIHAAVDTA